MPGSVIVGGARNAPFRTDDWLQEGLIRVTSGSQG